MLNMKCIFVFLLMLAFSSLAFAQGIDSVIIVSDATSADFLIAKAAGDKSGMPVLIAAGGEVTAELKSQLAELVPKTIILVGGPAVIKPEAEAGLAAEGYSVIRVWGLERTGTAVEAARFFWREGLGCAVLVDDTRNSDDDTEMQESASDIASHGNCSMIPVPAGAMPAEVLDMLQELNAKEIRFVGKRLAPEAREKLRQFTLREIIGVKEKVRDEIENEIISSTPRGKLKLVIIAAPHWRHVLGIGGYHRENAIVRIVGNVNQTAGLVELIRARNITDVRVVGFPALSQQIADQLNASGIAVKRISGEKASEVSHRVLKELLEKWMEKRADDKRMAAVHRERIKARLALSLNETEAYLDAQWVELEGLAAEGADAAKISTLKELISLAKSRLEEIQRKIDSGDFDAAEKLRFELKNNFEKSRFRFRLDIKWRIQDGIEAEEEGIEKSEARIDTSDVENRIAELKRRCGNATAVERLVEKAKSLREELKEAKEVGNYTGAAAIVREAHVVAQHAQSLRLACEKLGTISEKAGKIAEKRATMAEKIAVKVVEKFEVELKELPGSAAVNQSFRVVWRVKALRQLRIDHTAVHYDYASHPGELGLDTGPSASGYTLMTQEYSKGSFGISQTFIASITPDKEGTIYLRAHALIDGKNYWTGEKSVEIKAAKETNSTY